jgi:hypothetical protein
MKNVMRELCLSVILITVVYLYAVDTYINLMSSLLLYVDYVRKMYLASALLEIHVSFRP